MKKIFIFALCLLMMLSLCACKKDNTELSSSVEVSTLDSSAAKAVLDSGKITVSYEMWEDGATIHKNAEISLGMNSDDFKELIFNAEYERDEGENFIRYSLGGAYIYFENNDNDTGIVGIVYNGNIGEFQPTLTEKQQVLNGLGTPKTDDAAPQKAADMFLFGETGYTYVNYEKGDNSLAFFFSTDDRLSVSVLSQKDYWIY